MSLFSSILEKLGLKKPDAPAVTKPVTPAPTAFKPVVPTPGAPKPATPASPTIAPNYAPSTASAAALAGNLMKNEMSVVDVVSKLDKLAKANPQKLDWKVSIVDLLKLLDLDSSLAARKGLAEELGCPPAKIGGDYSEMNVWLHETVLKRIAENGGNIPSSLLK